MLLQLLIPGGFLSHKTDHADYFTETLKLLESLPFFSITEQSFDLHQSPYAAENIWWVI